MEKKLLILLVLICYSCNDTVSSRQKTAQPPVHTDQNIAPEQQKTKSDRFTFVSYNDDGDYTLLNARQQLREVQFINDFCRDRDLLRGDIVEIEWKQDTLTVAGDGEASFPADVLLSVTKIEDGKVSFFRKHHKEPLTYHWSTGYDYSQSYLDKLYLMTEYYIANSENRLLKKLIAENVQLTYSVEQQEREGTEYSVLGIGSYEEHHNVTVQWLFYDHEKEVLYEYDLPNDRLRYFDTVP